MGIIWCDKPHDNLWYYYQNSSEGNEEPALLKTGLSSAIEISIILALKGWRVIATKEVFLDHCYLIIFTPYFFSSKIWNG